MTDVNGNKSYYCFIQIFKYLKSICFLKRKYMFLVLFSKRSYNNNCYKLFRTLYDFSSFPRHCTQVYISAGRAKVELAGEETTLLLSTARLHLRCTHAIITAQVHCTDSHHHLQTEILLFSSSRCNRFSMPRLAFASLQNMRHTRCNLENLFQNKFLHLLMQPINDFGANFSLQTFDVILLICMYVCVFWLLILNKKIIMSCHLSFIFHKKNDCDESNRSSTAQRI